MVLSGLKETDIDRCEKLKHQVSKSNSLKVQNEKYSNRERKVDGMQTVLENLEHVNDNLPFLAALEHNPVLLRFTNKLIAKQRELREIEKYEEWCVAKYNTGNENSGLECLMKLGRKRNKLTSVRGRVERRCPEIS